METAALELIERIDVYEEGLNADPQPSQEELDALEERLASLLLKVRAKNGGYEAQAADGILCVEPTCPARDLDHQYGDNVCGYEMEIRRKNR